MEFSCEARGVFESATNGEKRRNLSQVQERRTQADGKSLARNYTAVQCKEESSEFGHFRCKLSRSANKDRSAERNGCLTVVPEMKEEMVYFCPWGSS